MSEPIDNSACPHCGNQQYVQRLSTLAPDNVTARIQFVRRCNTCGLSMTTEFCPDAQTARGSAAMWHGRMSGFATPFRRPQ